MRQLVSLFCVVLLAHCATAAPPQPTGKQAHCDLTRSSNGDHVGRVELNELKVDGVTAVSITAQLKGIQLADGPKGFHIHQFGKTGNKCLDAGPHFNPHNMQHGSPLDHTNRHVGDLGNVYVSKEEAKLNILDSRLKLKVMEEDQEGIVGRAIVLHEGEDDLGRGNQKDSLTTGAAGGRYACCIINMN